MIQLTNSILHLIPAKNIFGCGVVTVGRHNLILDSDGTIYRCGSNKIGHNPLKVNLLQIFAFVVSAGKVVKDGNNVLMGSGLDAYLWAKRSGPAS